MSSVVSLIYLMDEFTYQKLRVKITGSFIHGYTSYRKQSRNLPWKLLPWKFFTKLMTLPSIMHCGSQWEISISAKDLTRSLDTRKKERQTQITHFVCIKQSFKQSQSTGGMTCEMMKKMQQNTTDKTHPVSLLTLPSKNAISTKILN